MLLYKGAVGLYRLLLYGLHKGFAVEGAPDYCRDRSKPGPKPGSVYLQT